MLQIRVLMVKSTVSGKFVPEYVTLGKLLNLAMLNFIYILYIFSSENKNTPYFIGLYRLMELYINFSE